MGFTDRQISILVSLIDQGLTTSTNDDYTRELSELKEQFLSEIPVSE